jgi:predicted signal transduction protein with EAL and GGDEF domain
VAVALPGDRATSETLVRDADTALCRAKAGGPRRTVLFDVELREDALRQLHMVAVPGPG